MKPNSPKLDSECSQPNLSQKTSRYIMEGNLCTVTPATVEVGLVL